MIKTKQKLVNGPVVCFRLEGNVDGIKKVVYLFGDIHMQIGHESQCASWKSDNFVRYFSKTMSKTNKNTMYDLFFEVGKNPWTQAVGIRERYVDEVAKYFGSTLNIIEENKEQKVKNIGSKEEPNLRLHHVDIRELFRNSGMASDIFNRITTLYSNIKTHFDTTTNMVMQMRALVNMYTLAINSEIYLLLNDPDSKETEKIKEYLGSYTFEIIKNLFDKIKNKYRLEKVKKILINESPFLKLVDESEKQLLTCCEKLISHINNLTTFGDNKYNVLEKYDKSCLYGSPLSEMIKHTLPIVEEYERLSTYQFDIYVIIMDLYALRRMLDKEYITNVITYTGALHTCNYLHTLVKYFDFKITHTTNNMTIAELEKTIKEADSGENVFCKCMPKNLFQCIDMIHFPEKFE